MSNMNPAEPEGWPQSVRLLTQVLERLFQQVSIEPEPDLPLPEKYSGTRTLFAQFKTDCELRFALKPRTYARDFVKVRSAILLLTGRIKTWAHQLLLKDSPSLLTWGSFIKAMDAWEDQPRSRSSAQAAVTPREPAPPRRMDYTSPAPRALAGIGGRVKDIAVSRSLPRAVPAPSPRGDPSPVVRRPVSVPGVADHQHLTQSEVPDEEPMEFSEDSEHLDEGEPMELGYVGARLRQVTQDYRRRRGLCFYCGGEGHCISYCPIRPPQTRHPGSLTSAEETQPLSATSPQSLTPIPGPPREKQQGSTSKPNPGGSLNTDCMTDPCPLEVSAVTITSKKGATPIIPTGSALLTAEVALPLSATPAQSLSLVPVPLGVMQKEEVPEAVPGGSMDAGSGAYFYPIPSTAEVVRSEKSPKSVPVTSRHTLKALVAAHAAVLEPGGVLDYASGLPDLRTPGLFDDDPYTKEDPCPLSYASDGALIRTVDVGVYEKSLKANSKKSKKSKNK